jgi:hypothetical protein
MYQIKRRKAFCVTVETVADNRTMTSCSQSGSGPLILMQTAWSLQA